MGSIITIICKSEANYSDDESEAFREELGEFLCGFDSDMDPLRLKIDIHNEADAEEPKYTLAEFKSMLEGDSAVDVQVQIRLDGMEGAICVRGDNGYGDDEIG